jgi:hypothetical protein
MLLRRGNTILRRARIILLLHNSLLYNELSALPVSRLIVQTTAAETAGGCRRFAPLLRVFGGTSSPKPPTKGFLL